MHRARVVSLAVLAITAACARPADDVPSDLTTAIQAAAADALIPVFRPALPPSSGDGDAAADYLTATAALAGLPPELDAVARTRYGRFVDPAPLPPAVADALDRPAARAIVAAVDTGAGRTRVRSPFALSRAPGRDAQLVAVAELAVIDARRDADRGDPTAAVRALIRLVRMGQDLTRRAHHAGHAAGLTIERRAADAMLAILARVRPPPDRRAALAAELDRVLTDQPRARDLVVDQARMLLASAGVAAGIHLGIERDDVLAAPPPERLDAIGGAVGYARRARIAYDAIVALPDAPPLALAAAARAACAAAFEPPPGVEPPACAVPAAAIEPLIGDLERVAAARRALD